MDPLSTSLRRLLGRARFGVYALPRDGSSFLLTSSRNWPRSIEGGASLLHAARAIPAGDPRRAAADTILLPVGDAHGSGKRAALVVRAGPRATVWRLGAREWTEIARIIRDAVHDGRSLGAEIDPDAAALQRFHDALLAELPLGVLKIDATGKATYMSPAAAEILGILVGAGIGVDCFPYFESAGLDENPLRLGLQGKLHRFETYLVDADGHERPAWVQMSRIPDAPGGKKAREMLVILRDTSDERAFDEEMRRRERLASIGELSAGVAHEIRNPLTGIGNCAQVLRDRIPADDPRLRFVQIILDEAARLNRIVDSLLSFARPQRPQLRESDVTEVIRRVFEIDAERLAKGGISTEVRVSGRIPRIYIDPEQVLQVLLNVVRNAAESMPEGGRIDLECSIARRRPHLRRGVGQRKTDRFRPDGETPPAAYAQIRVGDTGRGIPPDVLPRVFDPFFTTRPKGTGLGLSISQSIIIEHGGFISVRSVEGRGTTVTIDLPVERRRGERRKGAW